MQVYLVGGAVRDQLLGRPVTERDYVVVGATPNELLKLGFNQVGADFPVFLHPQTHDEYALARTERKSGHGYLGFSIYAAPDVTLSDDLIRRDLTINAMAIEVNGLFDNGIKDPNVIDPYGGLTDLQSRQLRHVSAAFSEDPVRVLRLARFASRYAGLGFHIADDTKALVYQMHANGELNHLVAERVWAETAKALTQLFGDVYFDTLANLDALDVIMPALSKALEFQENWQITKASLRQAGKFGLTAVQRFALLATAFLPLPHLLNDFCNKLKVPKAMQQFAQFFINEFESLQQFDSLNAEQALSLLTASQALKDPTRLNQALSCIATYQLAKQLQTLQITLDQLTPISAKDVDPSLTGKAIGEAIQALRLQTLQNHRPSIL